jgi:hypothetical protein
MSKVFIIFLIFGNLCSELVMAQDLVVYNEGDSLNCNIIEQQFNTVLFSFKRGDELVTRELARNMFQSIVVGFYLPVDKSMVITGSSKTDTIQAAVASFASVQKDTIPVSVHSAPDSVQPGSPDVVINTVSASAVTQNEESVVGTTLATTEAIAISRWYAGVNGGYATRLFRMQISATDAAKAYQKDLKTGYSVGANGGYFLWKNVGLGLVGELYKSAASMEDGSRKDAISISYLGGSVVHRKVMQSQKSTVSTGFTLGYQTYLNSGSAQAIDFVMKGKAMGWGFHTGLDYKISQKVAVTFSASCLFGTLYKVTNESGSRKRTITLNKNGFEDLSRISFSVGLKFF